MDIVLVHGLWLDGHSWGAVGDLLEAEGHRVRALTLPGMESPGADRAGVTLADHVDAVVEAIDRCADPVLLVGHSAGAGVAWAAVDARPDWVSQLVLIGGFPTPDGLPLVEGLPVADGEVPFPGFDAFDESEVAGLDEAAQLAFVARALPSPARVVGDQQRLHDDRRYLVPVTVVCPEFTPSQIQSWVADGAEPVRELARITSVEYVDMATGHWPQISAPVALAAILLERAIGRPDPLDGVRLRGRAFRDRDLRGATIANSWVDELRIAGQFDHLWVNDVDVAPFVRAELDRLQPERAVVRAMTTAGEYRAAWAQIESMWSATVERVRQLPAGIEHRRVNGEWSMVHTLRHLVFATDCWVRRAMFDMPHAFHPWGVNHTEMLDGFAEAIGLHVTATPSLDDVLDVRADRMALVRSVLADLTDEQMATMSLASPAPDFPDERHPWSECLRVVMEEEAEHHRYAVRDLTALGVAPPQPR